VRNCAGFISFPRKSRAFMAITSKILLSLYLQNLTFSRNIPYRELKLFHDVQNVFSKSLHYLRFKLKININLTHKKQMSMD